MYALLISTSYRAATLLISSSNLRSWSVESMYSSLDKDFCGGADLSHLK
jgi:hypothetical protein